ncbi:ADP/ATP translocase 1-like [Apis laboriosa]|uniref:ADP/ATP translocase 1-like n=1 Tax=Apis laboriosa TaxID=183418 RepID=UPI001CC3FAE4|nr:ADP/ATP translocase 1-like [Apis laboriosa]
MTAPLERIKLILQTQASSRQIGIQKRAPYSGVLNAFIRIPKEQGFLSLWRGNLLNIIPSGTHNHIILPFLTGGSVGATSTMILYPLNFCNTRISVDVGDDKIIKREFSNLKDCLTKVYKNDGYRGFYQGSFYMAIAHSSYRSVYFGGYTIGKRIYLSNSLQDDKNSHTVTVPFLVSLLLAQSSSWAAIVIAYPFDTLARQKMLWSGRNAIEYPPMRHVMNNIIAKDGLFGFYKGVQANLMTTICGSSVLVTYDIVKFRFDKLMESYSKDLDSTFTFSDRNNITNHSQ